MAPSELVVWQCKLPRYQVPGSVNGVARAGIALAVWRMTPVFPFRAPQTQLFGAGAIEQIGAEANRLGLKKTLVVTDPGVARAGIADRVRQQLEASGVSTQLYDQA